MQARRWTWGLGIAASIIAVPIGTLGVLGLVREHALAGEVGHVCAELTAAEERHSRGRTEYLVKYQLVRDGVVYRRSDETGRTDLWADVTPDDWRRAGASGCVDVVFVPDDPATNRPARVSAANDPRANEIAALALAGLTLGLFAIAAWRIRVVARTRVWRLLAFEDGVWTVGAEGDEREIREVVRARLITLPRSRVHVPWRFATDVLELRLKDGSRVVVTASKEEVLTRAVAALDTRGALKRERAG
jgi:hypothetical protein